MVPAVVGLVREDSGRVLLMVELDMATKISVFVSVLWHTWFAGLEAEVALVEESLFLVPVQVLGAKYILIWSSIFIFKQNHRFRPLRRQWGHRLQQGVPSGGIGQKLAGNVNHSEPDMKPFP